ncbi:hypothetical protein TNCV_5090661 [Trichonephila clavipes]|nr:hypothetical protein TNCV_5090661 [Trichonephila clavipes]
MRWMARKTRQWRKLATPAPIPKSTVIMGVTNHFRNMILKGLGSNLGEDMDVCKCKVPLRQGGTLNNRRASSPLVWLWKRQRGGRPLPPRCPLSKLGWKRAKSYCHLYGAQSYG